MFSNTQPSEHAGDGDHGAVVAQGLVVADGEAAVLIEPREQVIDDMPCLAEAHVLSCRGFAARVGRDHGLRSHPSDHIQDGSPVILCSPFR